MNLAKQPEIEVFYGRVSPNSARVYARVSSLRGGQRWTLRGSVRGPHLQSSHTLPAGFAFRDLGDGPTLLAAALVSDPCFWSPRLPSLYDVQLELLCDGKVQRSVERSLGMRYFGSHGQHLILEGSRWVLRGIHSVAARESDLSRWRDVAAAMIVDEPTGEQCRRASTDGVLVVARLAGTDNLQQRLRRLAAWAATAVAILPDEIQEPEVLLRLAPNLLLAQWQSDQQPASPAEWAHLVFCEVSQPQRLRDLAEGCPLPIIAVRRLNEVQSLTTARRACDLLQRDLARFGDYAGYVV